ncbi:MAG: TROVE domain-containing protein [Promethearchaeota archaeon]
MPRKTKRMFAPIPVKEYMTADTFNLEGFPAWEKSDKELIVQFLYTNTLESTFYVNQKQLLSAALELFERFDDAKFLADTIVKARNEGFMRTAPILALAYLSKKDLRLFKKIFDQVIQTGKDLAQFLDIMREIRGLGRGIKKTVHDWLRNKTSEFYAIKYGNQLKDAIRLSRPRPDIFDVTIAKIHDYLIQGTVAEAFNKIKAFEELKQLGQNAVGNETQIMELIERGKLDYTVVVGALQPTPRIWIKLAEQMGTFALLRHLATFERHGVIGSLTQLITKRLTIENLEKAKILPFRIYEAYLNVSDLFVKEHLATLLDKYVTKYDLSWLGRVAICPDVSGSMTMNIRKAAYTPATIAGMFAGIFYKAIPNAIMIPWNNELQFQLVHPKNAPVLSHILSISEAAGGGTYMELPVKYLLKRRIVVDVVMIITDSEEWGKGWLKDWVDYKRYINPKAKAVLIRVDSYRTNPFDPELAGILDILQIYGWSDSVIKFIEFMLRTKEVVSYIT